ncbi:PLK protein kinase [Polytolypa hystricis UAMH7299]|uniref:PLK protein kinase n=1 Tax=Polytolypa hystricis (strain UAMH7299) TaxID=1447883 RepID=A0A2B7Z1P8_POLH7|nr:PLK protein kinase [Polytolypa hystricis UAMH7299]
MEALSPRSTNIPPKPKADISKKAGARDAPAAAKTASSKYHAPPPPALVREPVGDGEEYITGRFLGKGGFAVCYEGRLARNDRVFAMKVVKSEMNLKKMEEKFRTELQIHSKMRHPNIVGFHRAFAFLTSTYVILELCPNGSVMDMVRKRKCLSLPEVRRFMIQLCGAVKYMHKRNVAHRDLKMGNLFLDKDMDIKVGDFGLAAIILSEKDEKRRKTLCGTPNYIAPEVLDKSKGGHNQKVDIWSLGVIFFAMLTGYPPFQSKTQEEIYKKVKNLTYGWPKDSECANHIPAEAKDLVAACLSLDEEERPEPDQIVEHPFFKMYFGCIPRTLGAELRVARPAWIRSEDPRGDNMDDGYALHHDIKYATKIAHVKDADERYLICKDEFYTECGVGRAASGKMRKAAGKNCSKTAYAECIAEDERGLQPVIPLPNDRVYCSYPEPEGDWSLPKVDTGPRSVSPEDDEDALPRTRNGSLKLSAATMARTQTALAAQMRRKESQPQSHAAALRQQALRPRQSSRVASATPAAPPKADDVQIAAAPNPITTTAPRQGLLSERPIRTRSRVASGYSASVRETKEPIRPPLPKSSSAPTNLTIGKTRSQSRQHLAALAQQNRLAEDKPQEAVESFRQTCNVDLGEPIMSASVRRVKVDARGKGTIRAQEQLQSVFTRQETKPSVRADDKPSPATRGNEKTASSQSSTRSRSVLGLCPLIHQDEHPEIMPGSSVHEVMTDLKAYLSQLRRTYPSPSSNLKRSRREPPPFRRRSSHPLVVKWVDYTNRFGIGYVLDDGSVGSVFNGANGRPATCVVVREGERHIQRKVMSRESKAPEQAYSETDQYVPRNGAPVEFYENADTDSRLRYGGVLKRVRVQPDVFDVKSIGGTSGGVGIRVRPGVSIECARCDTEKMKRLRLVDQFGKYMIGSVGRSAEDAAAMAEDMNARHRAATSRQYIKFFQRLGNVGIWGFGDGSFQFNFPDHTKLIMSFPKSHTSSDSPPCQVDFCHLSPSAARYIARKGKMHPSGFNTRETMSNEIGEFFALLSTSSPLSPIDTRLCDILEANAFLKKIDFVKEVLDAWVQGGRLGCRVFSNISGSASSFASSNSATLVASQSSTFTGSRYEGHPDNRGELFWDGAQDRTWLAPSGGKFVWVTLGAQGGDREYAAVLLKSAPDGQQVECVGAEAMGELQDRLKALAM